MSSSSPGRPPGRQAGSLPPSLGSSGANILQGCPNQSIALLRPVSMFVTGSERRAGWRTHGVGFEGLKQCMLIRLFAYLLLSLGNSHLMPGLDETPAEMPLTSLLARSARTRAPSVVSISHVEISDSDASTPFSLRLQTKPSEGPGVSKVLSVRHLTISPTFLERTSRSDSSIERVRGPA